MIAAQTEVKIKLLASEIADKIKNGYTVTIRPHAESIKVTYHKEKKL